MSEGEHESQDGDQERDEEMLTTARHEGNTTRDASRSTSPGPWENDEADEYEVTLPPVPSVPTHPSLLYTLIGVVTLAGALYVAYYNIVSIWIFLPVMLTLAVIFGQRDQAHQQRLAEKFVPERINELETFIPDPAARAEHAQNEFKAVTDLSPTYQPLGGFAFLTVLAIAYFMALNVSDSLGWMWNIAANITTVVAALATFLLTGALMGSTFTIPVNEEFDYRSEADAGLVDQRLGISDQNDIEIITKAADLQMLLRRIDSYTLESALLSALSFSSFLSIILADSKDYIAEIQKLFGDGMACAALPDWSQALSTAVPQVCYLNLFSIAYIQENLVGLICLSLLICAAMFLGVLVARLRFNEGLRDAEVAIQTAERLNEKEEEAIKAGRERRAKRYAVAIRDYTRDADKLERELNPTVFVMRVSRDLGVLFFIVPLILCGFFFSPFVAGGLLVAFAVSLLFGQADRLRRKFKSKNIFDAARKKLHGSRAS
ncbi:MAG: hypothetical protein AAFZ01_01145 [Pseudomonadota bacterium]